jgi:hypothetical protein
MSAFVGKAINRAQHLSITDKFCAALNEFLTARGLVAWDDARALFWVKHPQDGWQVAVWLMPAAQQFEPRALV